MILDRFKVTGQVAVITGAGRGIGAASAIALAEAGADVVISARHSKQLAEVAEQVKAVGRRALVVKADLSDLEQTAGLAQAAYDEFGRLDIIVNNVGGTMPLPFLDTDEDFLVDAFKFNVATAHALTRAAVPLMLTGEDPGGSIVNISSVIGRVSGRGYVAYGTAKAALTHWTRLVSKDLAPLIRVNAIGTGSILTSALDYVASDESVMNELAEKTTMQRVGEVEDISAAVVYLASRAGAFLTGKVIEADGGLDIPNLDFNLPDLEAR
ncbi:MAG TPA: SDR family oxidoreductase [Marmoricola sp.]|jgi:7-alpha-hydroxysteroid dehydrogenase|nr:SDR family oxidoreductase [Marmoricola sp.]